MKTGVGVANGGGVAGEEEGDFEAGGAGGVAGGATKEGEIRSGVVPENSCHLPWLHVAVMMLWE